MVKTCARLWLARLLMNSSTKVSRLAVVQSIEQTAPLPDRPADCDFFLNHVEDMGRRRCERPAVSADDGRQRAPTLESDLETNVCQSEDQAVGGALSAADGHHARNSASDRKVFVRVEQRISEVTDVLRRHLSQRTDGIVGDGSQASSGMTCRDQVRVSAPRPGEEPRGRDRDRAIEGTGCRESQDRRRSPALVL